MQVSECLSDFNLRHCDERIVYHTLATHIAKKQTEKLGVVTPLQHFLLALNLNIYFHMLFLGGVYIKDKYVKTYFHQIKTHKK